MRRFKHWFRHEWRDHPSMQLVPASNCPIVGHYWCTFPGCGLEWLALRDGTGYFVRCPE